MNIRRRNYYWTMGFRCPAARRRNPEEARRIAGELAQVVVKAQIHAGGREKGREAGGAG